MEDQHEENNEDLSVACFDFTRAPLLIRKGRRMTFIKNVRNLYDPGLLPNEVNQDASGLQSEYLTG